MKYRVVAITLPLITIFEGFEPFICINKSISLCDTDCNAVTYFFFESHSLYVIER